MLLKHKLRGCFVIIRRNWSSESLRWLTRCGQSVRLPELPAFPNNVEQQDQANQADQQNQNNLLNEAVEGVEVVEGVAAVEVDMNPMNPVSPLHVDAQEQPIQLNQELRNLQKITAGKRRVSVAGRILFSVNDAVRETGSDFMTKPIMASNIIAQPVVQNQFDTFQRIQNPPFTLRGRKRAASFDGYFQPFVPHLTSIPE